MLNSEQDIVPSPGWMWDGQLYFEHPDATPSAAPETDETSGPGDIAAPQPDEELPSLIQIQHYRPYDDEERSPEQAKAETSEQSPADDNHLNGSPGDVSVRRTRHAIHRPEREMVLALSLGQLDRVVWLYDRSLDVEGLPASPFALEIAVEASLRAHSGQTEQANIILRTAKKAGMNITGAMGPMLTHAMKRIS
ncbi:hypothetical protein LTR53_018557, partial [Teratosphaeriaceae sp. CCFEE 6253]